MYSLTEAVCRTGGKREKSYGLPLSWIDQFSLGPIEGGRTGGGWHPSWEWGWGTEGARVSLRVLEGARF